MKYRNEKIRILELCEEIGALENISCSTYSHVIEGSSSCSITISNNVDGVRMSKTLRTHFSDGGYYNEIKPNELIKELEDFLQKQKRQNKTSFINRLFK